MPLPSDVQLNLVNSVEEASNLMSWLGNRREVLAVDTETSGLDPYAPGAKLRLIQLGDEHTGWAIPWERWGGVAMEALTKYEEELTFHNLPFDAPWLKIHAGWEVPWHRTHDTLIMAQIERPGGRNDLKYLSKTFVDPTADAGQKDLKKIMKQNGWDWGTIPTDFDEYWVYSALDTVLGAHLKAHFRTNEKLPEVYDLEMAVRRVCSRMEYNGMRVDTEYSKFKYDQLMQYVEDSKVWAQENWGISIGSNPQLAQFFQSALGAKFDKHSEKTGNPSVDKEQLGKFRTSNNPAIRDVANFILGVRSAEKMGNSYFKNFLEMNTDGIVHPSIKTMGARTGRMSVINPALQTIPRGDATVRDAFIPRRAGEVIISCDYSQVEMRLLAHFSRDPVLQNAFREADATGGDFFVGLGKQIYGDPDFSKKDPRRGLVKGTLYGSAYGSGIQKMAETAGVTYDQMAEVAQGVFSTFPGIKGFMAEIESLGSKREKEEGIGYIITEGGRKLPCDPGRVYSLTNYMLQGTAAELMKKAIVRLDAAGYTDYCQVPIHDEMVFSLPEADAQDAMKDIEEIMSYCNGEFAVDLPAEAEGGLDRWGSKYRKKGEVFGYDPASLLAA
jgi:DNA polymerase-1